MSDIKRQIAIKKSKYDKDQPWVVTAKFDERDSTESILPLTLEELRQLYDELFIFFETKKYDTPPQQG